MNSSFKDIVILVLVLFVIMLVSTLIVLGFNATLGFSTDVSNDDVLTAISIVSFLLAIVLKYFYEKKFESQ
jgi:hypothetical protein